MYIYKYGCVYKSANTYLKIHNWALPCSIPCKLQLAVYVCMHVHIFPFICGKDNCERIPFQTRAYTHAHQKMWNFAILRDICSGIYPDSNTTWFDVKYALEAVLGGQVCVLRLYFYSGCYSCHRFCFLSFHVFCFLLVSCIILCRRPVAFGTVAHTAQCVQGSSIVLAAWLIIDKKERYSRTTCCNSNIPYSSLLCCRLKLDATTIQGTTASSLRCVTHAHALSLCMYMYMCTLKTREPILCP